MVEVGNFRRIRAALFVVISVNFSVFCIERNRFFFGHKVAFVVLFVICKVGIYFRIGFIDSVGI